MSDRDREILEFLSQAKQIAQRYRALTGKPLGITGEVAEYEAARLLDLKLVEARQAMTPSAQPMAKRRSSRSKDACCYRTRSPASASAP